MSASTRTAQPTLSTGRMGAALAAIALTVVLGAIVAFGQLAAAKPQTAPAAVPAPVVLDRGSRDEIGVGGTISTPVVLDRGGRGDVVTGGTSSGTSNGPRLRPH